MAQFSYLLDQDVSLRVQDKAQITNAHIDFWGLVNPMVIVLNIYIYFAL